MINESDIDLMHAWRDEMITNRQRPVSVVYVDKERDPLTGAVIGEKEHTREVIAVVTELSIKSSSGSRSIEGGVVFDEGDIKVDVSIELVADIAPQVVRIYFDDKDYEVLGSDKKGIGRRNRYEFIGREIV